MSRTIVGTFEPSQKGGGFLRSSKSNYSISRDDVFVPQEPCQKLRLQGGETVVGTVRAGKSGKPARFNEVETINGLSLDAHLQTKPFKELIAIDPEKRVTFETDGGPLTMRVIDLMTPIGFGTRGLLVAPPRTGKTILLQQMAHGVATNFPDVYMMVLLIDERPEEVTEMRREVHGEVIASSNDEDVASHVRIARLMIQKAKRHVECGQDVLVLLDSLTRVARAFNVATRGRGRTMSGGLDAGALTEPKSIFGAARNVEGGASLTIIASALIETGSRMDEVIFNEFKGTGNMEIMLTRELANMRIWPAIDLQQSGTRKEERLLSPAELEASHQIRRTIINRDPRRSMETLLERMGKFSNNNDFVKDFGSRGGFR